MNIALIEDEPDCYEPYSELLKARGHTVTIYSEADDVVDSLEKIVKSDVIILDLMIQLGTKVRPEEASETGIALYRRIRKIAIAVPIVVITARVKKEVWPDFQSDVRVSFLAKPINNLETFYSTIEGMG